ncbi:MAG: 23S rRNA pseudouridine955/2504/2580 synthase [Candidatus Midichloriaceae bacterium]|jgi:23S rRNA pseudouridine955/2504/2580 synthase
MEIKSFLVQEIDNNIRLDRWFQRNVPLMPFIIMAKLLRKGQIRVDGKRAKIHLKIKTNQKIRAPIITFDDKKKNQLIIPNNFDEYKAEFDNSIIFEDENFIVLNKPYGLCVQDGTKVKMSVDRILKISKIEGKIVHRIDKETTGLLLVAKNSAIASKISELLRERKVKKKYLAVLCGILEKAEGSINIPIKKSEGDSETELPSQTNYKVLKQYKDKFSLVEMTPITGRKHQIRIHCAAIGHPILGDRKHKTLNDSAIFQHEFLHLHAHCLNFELMEKPYELQAKLPTHFLDTLKKYKLDF